MFDDDDRSTVKNTTMLDFAHRPTVTVESISTGINVNNANLFYYAPVCHYFFFKTMTGEQLVRGYYAVAWVAVEPTTFEFKAELFPLSHSILLLSFRFTLCDVGLRSVPDIRFNISTSL